MRFLFPVFWCGWMICLVETRCFFTRPVEVPHTNEFHICSPVAPSLNFVPFSWFVSSGERYRLVKHTRSRPTNVANFYLAIIMLLLSGDIEVNPGPDSLQHARFAHFNCRSIFPNNDFDKPCLIEDFMTDNQVDILSVCETWIPPNAPPSLVASVTPDGFCFSQIPRKDTTAGRGGGVGFLFKKTLNFPKIILPEFQAFEVIGHKLITANKSYICLSIYRHLSNPVAQFFDEFKVLLESLATSPSDLILLGDFNFHINKIDSNSQSFMQLLEEFNLNQYVNFSTHDSGNYLDLFISNTNKDQVISIQSAHIPFSDHEPYLCTLKLKISGRPIEQYKTCRIFKSFCPQTFSQELLQTELFTNNNENLNVNEYTTLFYSTIKTILDRLAPEKRIKVNLKQNKPFYNAEIKKQKKIRSKLESIWRKNKTDENKTKFKTQAKHVAKLIRNAKQNYYLNLVKNNVRNPKKLWNTLSSLLGNKFDNILPHSISDSNLANTFLHFFNNKVTKLCSAFQSSNVGASVHFPEPPANVPILNTFEEATVEEVAQAIGRSSDAFISSDLLPAKYLKMCLPILIQPITRIVNLSLTEGTFPEIFKSSIVRPLLKKYDLAKDDLASYRPVSNLYFLSKIIERIVQNRLNKHLLQFPDYGKFQSAYKPYHSCETALTRIANDLLMAAERKNVTALVLLDLSAAFDTVDHQILKDRLQSYFGVQGDAHKWFSSYLAGRQQCVQIGNDCSAYLRVDTGVPQGSVLGPILFSLYTSPLQQILSEDPFGYHLYADDTQVYISFPPTQYQSAIQKLSNKLNEVYMWLNNNKLTVNPSKTEFLIIGTKQQCDKIETPNITFCNSTIVPSTCIRNLGVLFDSHLTFSQQISKVCQTSFFQIRLFRTIRPYLNVNTAICLANALVSSRLDFCNILYHGLPQYKIDKLQMVQNALVRAIFPEVKFRDHITPVLNKLHWLPIFKRINFKLNVTTYKTLKNHQPKYLHELLKPLPHSNRRSSSRNLLMQPFVKLETGRRAFEFAAPKQWNYLPQEIRDTNTVHSFRRLLKAFLFPP